jgi:molybdopterin biosynthesis enzyme
MLKAQLSCSGFSPGVALHASSERERLTSALEQTAACCEVFLAFGGTGSVSAILDELGYSFLFRMVAQHPAGSLACARGPCGQMVFIMQADLLSALVSTEEYVLPCLRSMSGYKGCRKRVFLGETTFEYSKEPDRQHFIGTLAYREGSAWKLHRPEQGGSGDLTGTGSINSLAIAGSQQISLRNGDPMPFHFLCSAAGEISFA